MQPVIIRIISVRDTRDYEEQDDRWVPIPGSGLERECDRCHRTHEVHVDVELSDGTTACVGRGCARGDSMETSIKGAISSETTRARLARQLDKARSHLSAAQAAWSDIAALPLPAVKLVERRASEAEHRGEVELWAFEGREGRPVWCYVAEGGFNAERRACLVGGWRQECYWQRGFRSNPDSIEGVVRDLERRLDRAARKVREACAARSAA